MGPGTWWGAPLLDGAGEDVVWTGLGTRVTRARVRERVAELVRLLDGHGVRPRQRVSLRAQPSFTQLWLLLALWSREVQVVLVDPWLTGPEVDELLRSCAPSHHIRLGGPGRTTTAFRRESEVTVRPAAGGRAPDTAHCLVQFSSGATGVPKVVGRVGDSLLAEVRRFASLDGMPARGDRLLLLHPMSHSLGLIGGVLHALHAGSTVVFTDGRDAGTPASTAEDVTAVFGLPRHFAELSRAATRLPALRLAVSGGEALTPAVRDAFAARHGVAIGQAYGMTEVGVIAADLRGAHPPPAVGAPAPGVVVRVVDGELHVRQDTSPYLRGGGGRYADGWLRTGDLVDRDAAGVLRLRGRVGSTARVSGREVDLLEVEAVLRAHHRVTEAVVVHDGVLEAHLAVTGAVGPAELTGWCRAHLGAPAVPVRFHVVSALPRTANGKLIRDAERLRAAYAAGARPRWSGKRLA
ncbi:class I adenylate-forming enzyme family protein [Saccharothrix obliqua]|uniref:class I adenylate-forming enzyme family protein n=1 Tax=Saccharothrix obliqua TaxID=2861747 RepID=UPI001C606D96|nr:class I adenylate-forming enzyme family protein [Saccharothrix obliqua]MBW4721476.1 acyl--CoA ligase [Saccharothrix obliqua]